MTTPLSPFAIPTLFPDDWDTPPQGNSEPTSEEMWAGQEILEPKVCTKEDLIKPATEAGREVAMGVSLVGPDEEVFPITMEPEPVRFIQETGPETEAYTFGAQGPVLTTGAGAVEAPRRPSPPRASTVSIGNPAFKGASLTGGATGELFEDEPLGEEGGVMEDFLTIGDGIPEDFLGDERDPLPSPAQELMEEILKDLPRPIETPKVPVDTVYGLPLIGGSPAPLAVDLWIQDNILSKKPLTIKTTEDLYLLRGFIAAANHVLVP